MSYCVASCGWVDGVWLGGWVGGALAGLGLPVWPLVHISQVHTLFALAHLPARPRVTQVQVMVCLRVPWVCGMGR